mgnify:CR=1 FL=1
MKRSGIAIISVLAIWLIIIVIVNLTIPASTTFRQIIQLCGLIGLFIISLLTIMTPFMKELYQIYGKPFIKLHHFLVPMGIALISLHPIFLAIESQNIAVFLPNFSSWLTFWQLAGRPALILLYIAFVASLLRKKIPQVWRPIHMLMYLVQIMGVVHGNLIGSTFTSPSFGSLFIVLSYYILGTCAIIAFIWKRIQRYRLKTK